MQPMVAIKTDISAPSGAKARTQLGNDAGESFSSEFDRQLSTSPSSEKNRLGTKNSETVQSKKADKQEETVAENGKNLPEEDHDQIKAETTKSSEQKQDTSSSSESEETEITTVNTDAAELVSNTEVVSEPISNEQSTSTENSEDSDPNEKVVLVNQHAVDNAKTQAVQMQARERQNNSSIEKVHADKAAVSQSVQSETDTELESAEVSKVRPSPLVNNKSENTDKLMAGIEKVLPETAKQSVEKSNESSTKLKSVESSTTPAPIRADILDAIKNKSTSDGEVQMSVKNIIAAQLQAQGSGDVPVDKNALLSAVESKLDKKTLSTTQPAGFVLSPAATSSSTGATATLTTQPVSLDVQPTVQSAVWSKVMAGRVVYMAKEGIQQAELKLKPANMGPVEVKLHIQNEQVSVTFLAQHASTREALEQALPRLRESFAENGIELANAEVGAQTQQEQPNEDTEQSSSAHIFSQAGGQEDDIEIETEIIQQADDGEVGLSLYA